MSVILVLGPPLGLIVCISLAIARGLWLHHRRTFERVRWFSIVVVVVTGTGALAKLDTVSVSLNVAVCCAAFFAYCFVAASAWRLEPRPVRIATAIAAYTLLIPVYLMTVVLLLVSHFDETRPALHAEQIRPGVSCQIIEWGLTLGEEGYTVHVYRYLPAFPLVRMEAAHVAVLEADPESEFLSKVCARVAARL